MLTLRRLELGDSFCWHWKIPGNFNVFPSLPLPSPTTIPQKASLEMVLEFKVTDIAFLMRFHETMYRIIDIWFQRKNMHYKNTHISHIHQKKGHDVQWFYIYVLSFLPLKFMAQMWGLQQLVEEATCQIQAGQVDQKPSTFTGKVGSWLGKLKDSRWEVARKNHGIEMLHSKRRCHEEEKTGGTCGKRGRSLRWRFNCFPCQMGVCKWLSTWRWLLDSCDV